MNKVLFITWYTEPLFYIRVLFSSPRFLALRSRFLFFVLDTNRSCSPRICNRHQVPLRQDVSPSAIAAFFRLGGLDEPDRSCRQPSTVADGPVIPAAAPPRIRRVAAVPSDRIRLRLVTLFRLDWIDSVRSHLIWLSSDKPSAPARL
jgi:hypothetical protein